MRVRTDRTRRIITILAASLLAQNARAESFRATVKSDRDLPSQTPVLVPLKHPLTAGAYRLIAKKPDLTLSAQVVEDQGKSYLAFLAPRWRRPKPSSSKVRPIPSRRKGLRSRPKGETSAFRSWERLHSLGRQRRSQAVFVPLARPYRPGDDSGVSHEKRGRRNRDHPHQRSFWFTHGNVNGVDFWSEIKGHGSIRETAGRPSPKDRSSP